MDGNSSHKKFRDEILNKVSPSFCAAKWLNATIWLNSGMTASCHHPTPHFAGTESVLANPAHLHNTVEKKLARAEMLLGKRPAECEYCWKIEDLSADHVSDRVFKSNIYSVEEIETLSQLSPQQNVIPRTLEIAFDRICNFACSYCSPHFSTSWVKDIKTSGPYKGLTTDTHRHYENEAPSAEPFKGQDNPFITAFWKWWPELKKNLQQLRITGGEPLLSPHVWQILKELNIHESPQLKLAINSNLGSSPAVIQKLVQLSETVPHLEIYTSNEAFEKQAEYIRDGLNWAQWKENCELLIRTSKIKTLHVMLTINGLCLFSLPSFLDQLLQWKKLGPVPVVFSINILRFPEFQSALVLPLDIRSALLQDLSTWYQLYKDQLLDFEASSLERLLHYLAEVQQGTGSASTPLLMQKDLKRFILQYDQRRGKNFKNVFPQHFVQWITELDTSPSPQS